MNYYVVTDDKGYAHLVEGNSPGDAITQIPGGEAVRIAHQRDIETHLRQQQQEEE